MTKIATWNVNSLKVRLAHVLEWLQKYQPDVLALQETKLIDENFPQESFIELGYEVVFSGQKTYNGVALISKLPPKEVLRDIPSIVDVQRRILVATYQDIRVINLYIPNGQSVESDKYQYKLQWLEKMSQFIQEQLTLYSKVIVLGDFNIAPTDEDVRDPDVWRGHIHCSEPEREYFRKWLDLGLKDTFRLFEQPEKTYSWWDYRNLAFRRNKGLRIDHILVSEALADSCKACLIDKEPRKLERPSDHAPVLAEFAC